MSHAHRVLWPLVRHLRRTGVLKRYGKALHRAIKKHRARLRIQRDQAHARMARRRTSSCERKKQYSTVAFAQRVADKVLREQGVQTYAYACEFCGRAHLTKQERRP